MSVTDNTQLWDVLYSWASSILTGVEITESHENAPTPSGNFVCIDYAGSWRLAGTNASRMNVNDTEHVSPRIYVYKGEIEIRVQRGMVLKAVFCRFQGRFCTLCLKFCYYFLKIKLYFGYEQEKRLFAGVPKPPRLVSGRHQLRDEPG